MLKLVTGSPGDGKTSNELWAFLHDPAYVGRPKFCTPINGFEPHLHGVIPIDHLSVWEDLPEGSVIFVDEVQDYCGTDLSAQKPPEWVKQLARHRHTGKDFIFTTQSPMFLHAFARKLAKPHVHYTRPWNMSVQRYQWDAVQGDPNSPGAKKIGVRKGIKTNPEVFKLYTSTVLDTHKARPPWKLIGLFAACLLIIAICVPLGMHLLKPEQMGFKQNAKPPEASSAAKGGKAQDQGLPPPGEATGGLAVGSGGHAPVWTQDSMKPRIPGLPYTAPVYDSLTAPTDFPRTAACVESRDPDRCDCYTQQGTPLDVPISACIVYVHHGSFDPWLSGRQQAKQNQNVAIGKKAEDMQAAKQQVHSAGDSSLPDPVAPEPAAAPITTTFRAHLKPAISLTSTR